MTEIDYLSKHPLDFTVENGQARLRLFFCRANIYGRDDHPVLQLHEPAGLPDEDAAVLPFNDVVGALGYLLLVAASIVVQEAALKGSARKEHLQSGFEIATAVVRFNKEMLDAVKRATLN